LTRMTGVLCCNQLIDRFAIGLEERQDMLVEE
jgi:hypothetical protein